jgi:hypothetical protein
MSALPERSNQANAAVSLRVAGATYGEIAETLGYSSAANARNAVEISLAARAGENDRESLRRTEGARLDRLLRGVWRKATDDTHPEHLAAVSRALAIIDRHIRLFGADAPQEMIHYTPTQEQMDAWVAQMSRQYIPDVPEADVIEIEP